jgi:hypothetical protein
MSEALGCGLGVNAEICVYEVDCEFGGVGV